MTNDENQKPEDIRPLFVFGSNLSGRHGKGAALTARNEYGAVYGVGVGRTGNAYAIPTKDAFLRTLPLDAIESYVKAFLFYARENPELKFFVTRVGTGLAGYKDAQISPFFKGAPDNCQLPLGWREHDQNPPTPGMLAIVDQYIADVEAEQERIDAGEPEPCVYPSCQFIGCVEQCKKPT